MATYTASKMQPGVQPKALPDSSGVNVLSTINQAVALLLNDVINFMVIPVYPSNPNGPAIIGVELDVDKLDSNGSPTIKLNVGDSNSGGSAAPTRFFNQSTIAQAGGYAIPTIPAILGLQYTANSTIFATVQTAPATFQAGNLRLLVGYTFDV